MKKVSVLILALGLAGCAAAQAQSEFERRFAAEGAAWRTTREEAVAACYHGVRPEDVATHAPERSEAVASSNCMSKLVQEKVLPEAVFPDLLVEYRTKALRGAEAYAKGEISAVELSARASENWIWYTQQVTARAGEIVGQAAQQDAVARESFRQGLAQQQQAIQAQANRPPLYQPVLLPPFQPQSVTLGSNPTIHCSSYGVGDTRYTDCQ